MPSVPDGGSEHLSQSESATTENWFCTRVSPATAGRRTGVQNVLGVVPSVPDGGSEHLSQSESATPENWFCTRDVQNVQNRCPKWGYKLKMENGKLKMKNINRSVQRYSKSSE